MTLLSILLQGLVVLFAVFAWSRAFLRFKDRKMSVFGFLTWSLVWGGFLTIILLPKTSRFITRSLGINRPVDGLVYFTITLLLYFVFRLYIQTESLKSETTAIVRALAIERATKK